LVLESGEPLSHRAGAGLVTLALLTVEGLVQARGRVLVAAGKVQDLGAVGVAVCLEDDVLASPNLLDRLVGEAHCRVGVALVGFQLSSQGAPPDLRIEVVLAGQSPSHGQPMTGGRQVASSVAHLSQHRCESGQVPFVASGAQEVLDRLTEDALGACIVAGSREEVSAEP
jgi:hypothetical protein